MSVVYNEKLIAQVRFEVEESELSFKQIADKYELPKSTVTTWAKKYGWKRNNEQSKVRTAKVHPGYFKRELAKTALPNVDTMDQDIDLGAISDRAHEQFCSQAVKNAKLFLDKLEKKIEDEGDELSPGGLKILSEINRINLETIIRAKEAMTPTEDQTSDVLRSVMDMVLDKRDDLPGNQTTKH